MPQVLVQSLWSQRATLSLKRTGTLPHWWRDSKQAPQSRLCCTIHMDRESICCIWKLLCFRLQARRRPAGSKCSRGTFCYNEKEPDRSCVAIVQRLLELSRRSRHFMIRITQVLLNAFELVWISLPASSPTNDDDRKLVWCPSFSFKQTWIRHLWNRNSKIGW